MQMQGSVFNLAVNRGEAGVKGFRTGEPEDGGPGTRAKRIAIDERLGAHGPSAILIRCNYAEAVCAQENGKGRVG